MKPVLFLAALAVLAVPGAAQARRYPPRDACAKVEGARDFRRALTTAVANRDAAMLAQLASPDILLDFGGGSGRETLVERLDDPHYRLWRELDALLLLGCAPASGEDAQGIALPWYWGQRIDEVDAMEGMLATGGAVALRAAPSDDAELLGSLAWDAVALAGPWEPDAPFLKVKVPGGKVGYVRQDQLRSLVDYRLLAAPVDGKWQITALVAGD
ncbi:MAG: SH3 domain-containing protein [Sphingomonadales bacterium]|nr:SH3 domain-containing protein [Sphingomonadales bacterium]MBD3774471.1 SH3 domain-containing protein [Paracoccaceae bacterium]